MSGEGFQILHPTNDEIFKAGNDLIANSEILYSSNVLPELQEKISFIARGLETQDTLPMSMNVLRILYSDQFSLPAREMVRASVLGRVNSIAEIMTNPEWSKDVEWPVDAQSDSVEMAHTFEGKLSQLHFLSTILVDENFEISPSGVQQEEIIRILRKNKKFLEDSQIVPLSLYDTNQAEDILYMLASHPKGHDLALQIAKNVVTRDDVSFFGFPSWQKITTDKSFEPFLASVLGWWAQKHGIPAAIAQRVFWTIMQQERYRFVPGLGRFTTDAEEKELPNLMLTIAKAAGRPNIDEEINMTAEQVLKKRYKEKHPESEEEDIEYITIPKIQFVGYAPTTAEVEAYRNQLREFFSDKSHLERVVWVPQIPRDMLDGFGISGLRDTGGFIFIEKLHNFGSSTLAEALWADRERNMVKMQTPNGKILFTVQHMDMVPTTGKFQLAYIIPETFDPSSLEGKTQEERARDIQAYLLDVEGYNMLMEIIGGIDEHLSYF